MILDTIFFRFPTGLWLRLGLNDDPFTLLPQKLAPAGSGTIGNQEQYLQFSVFLPLILSKLCTKYRGSCSNTLFWVYLLLYTPSRRMSSSSEINHYFQEYKEGVTALGDLVRSLDAKSKRDEKNTVIAEFDKSIEHLKCYGPFGKKQHGNTPEMRPWNS